MQKKRKAKIQCQLFCRCLLKIHRAWLQHNALWSCRRRYCCGNRNAADMAKQQQFRCSNEGRHWRQLDWHSGENNSGRGSMKTPWRHETRMTAEYWSNESACSHLVHRCKTPQMPCIYVRRQCQSHRDTLRCRPLALQYCCLYQDWRGLVAPFRHQTNPKMAFATLIHRCCLHKEAPGFCTLPRNRRTRAAMQAAKETGAQHSDMHCPNAAPKVHSG
mmetsp:Transcript_34216/g.72858  ORF Transcript_34216/g.72858 Transcript_34216/m.72858 type:complete len:217 (+) Transcript_34216:289-939(+)